MTVKTEIDYQMLYNEVCNHPNAQIISYGISDKYVQHWSEINSLIEYLANFYDENGLNFEIIKEKNAVVLRDKSKRGIKLEDLAFGNSESRNLTTKIGEKGEGFKLGTIPLLRNDKKVLLETVGNTIVFYFEYDTELKSNILKSKVLPNNRKEGTTAYLETDKLKEASERFLFLNENLVKINDFLYKPKKGQKNYLFVNTFGGQAIDSIFSYSIHKKQKVNRDRNIIENADMDLLLSLFTTKDENMIKEWLFSLRNPNFDFLFEGELLKFFFNNRNKKEFKSLDFTLWKKVARENKVVFIPYSLDTNERKRLKIVASDYTFLYKSNWATTMFCQHILENEVNLNDFPLANLSNGTYHFPIVEYNHHKVNNDRDAVENLLDYLSELKLLKSSIKKGDTIHLTFNNKKIDYLEGKVEGLKKDFRHTINQVFYSIYKLSAKNSFSGWDFGIDNDKLPIIKFKDTPTKLSLKITDKNLSKEFDSNIRFLEKKVLLKGRVYQFPTQQYMVVQNMLDEKINSLFSYDYDILKYSFSLEESFSNARVVKPILKAIKARDLPLITYELKLINKLLTASHIYYEKTLKEVWTKSFVEVFSPKSYISTTPEMDKKLKYNKYEIVDLPREIHNLFIKFGIRIPPNQLGHTSASHEGILEKPSHISYEEFIDSPYHQVFMNTVVLSKTLEDVYQIVNGLYGDKRYYYLMGLLPYNGDKNKLATRRSGSLYKATASKQIREYCFKVYNNTFIVDFENENIRGKLSENKIYLEFEFMNGTFFHEYVVRP